MADERGDAWEHDPGPTTASGWATLFAETPNYRGLGRAVLGREAFRWHHGPMFFRGRLDGSAKVVLVGQEGAQDESLSHRSFTGGTGARMQHLLRHLGLDRSYLFLNSFVYPIFGQYTDDLRPLAQDPRSPIVAHRHRIFDQAIGDGDARLVVAVGNAAKESVATWVGAHGGSADPDHLDNATLGGLPGRLRLAGVVHPGSAAGGSTSAIKADFQRACNRIKGWLDADAGWLPADPGVPRDLGAPFQYKSAAIRTATSRSAPARVSAAAAPPATAPTPSGASACSQPVAPTTPPAPTCRTPPPPPAAATATTTPATCPTSPRAPEPPPSTRARRAASRACCWAWSRVSAGRTSPPSASPPTPPSVPARSTGAGSRT